MELSLTGKIIAILPNVEGESSRGPWIKGGFVIETYGEYPKKVAFTVFGETRLERLQQYPVGTSVTVLFNADSHEFGEKWYTSLNAYSFVPQTEQAQPTATPPSGYAPAPAQPTTAAPAYYPQNPTATPQYTYAQQAMPPAQPQSGVTMPEDDQLPF